MFQQYEKKYIDIAIMLYIKSVVVFNNYYLTYCQHFYRRYFGIKSLSRKVNHAPVANTYVANMYFNVISEFKVTCADTYSLIQCISKQSNTNNVISNR